MSNTPVTLWTSLCKNAMDRLQAGDSDANLVSLMDGLLAFFIALSNLGEGVRILHEVRVLPAVLPLIKCENREILRLVSTDLEVPLARRWITRGAKAHTDFHTFQQD